MLLCAEFLFTWNKRLVVLGLFIQSLHKIATAAHLDTDCLNTFLNSFAKLRLIKLILRSLRYIVELSGLRVVDETRVQFYDVG